MNKKRKGLPDKDRKRGHDRHRRNYGLPSIMPKSIVSQSTKGVLVRSRIPPDREIGIIKEILTAVAADFADDVTRECGKCMIETNGGI